VQLLAYIHLEILVTQNRIWPR